MPLVSVLVAFLEDPAADRYGLELMSQTALASGSLYPILTRLRSAGWVESRWEDIDPAAEGRPARRYYRLTPEGVTRAEAAVARVRDLTAARTREGRCGRHGDPAEKSLVSAAPGGIAPFAAGDDGVAGCAAGGGAAVAGVPAGGDGSGMGRGAVRDQS